MGQIVNVYRPADGHQSTNGGISSVADTLTVVNIPGPFEPQPDRPAAMLVDSPLGMVKIVVPAEQVEGVWRPMRAPAGSVGPMNGGNFAGSSDREFGGVALRIHDRFETTEQYAALSR